MTIARSSTENKSHGSCEGASEKNETRSIAKPDVTPILTRVTLKEDQPLKEVISPSCDSYFTFGSTKAKKSEIYTKPKTIEKPDPKKDHFDPPPEPPRCKLCNKILYEHEHEICETCRHRQQRRYFKGVPGLQDLPLSKIALLPQGARELYLKHMDCAEADQLNAIILRNKQGT